MAKKMEMVLVSSKVKGLIKVAKCNTAGDALAAALGHVREVFA